MPTEAYLTALMGRYTVGALVDVDADDFERTLRAFLGSRDPAAPNDQQLAVGKHRATRFEWGHDHDFGTFHLRGKMGHRHVRHVAEFIDRFAVLPADLAGVRILDVGCWTGGTSLLLAAMGARVLAIEEVPVYARCADYLRRCFDVAGLEVRNCSLFDCTTPDFQDAFDFVLFAGVLYHVTDPIMALRIAFNALKDGGACLLETTGFRSRKPLVSFARRRWNWFDISPPALRQMLDDVGYDDVALGKITPDRRLYAVARRQHHVGMRRDGLSKQGVR